MNWTGRLVYLGPLLGVAIAIAIAHRSLSVGTAIPVQDWLWIVGLVIVGILSPFFINGVRYQHVCFKARKQGQAMHCKAMKQLKDLYARDLVPEQPTATNKEAAVLAKLEQVARVHHNKIGLKVFDSPRRYFNVGKRGPGHLLVMVTSATLAQLSPSELSKLVSETIVFQELCHGGVFNPPQCAIPASQFVYVDVEASLGMAWFLHLQAKTRLKKSDQLLGLDTGQNFNTRRQGWQVDYKEQNLLWL